MFKVRFCYEKKDTAAYISHLDLIRTFQRSFLRAGLPVKYSQGFNPHIEMSIVVPLSTGYDSVCELCDLELTEDSLPEDFVQRLNVQLPAGMKVLSAAQAVRPVGEIAFCSYEITLPAGDAEKMQALFQKPVFVEKRSKRGVKQVNLLDYIPSLSFAEEGEHIICRCTLAAGNDSLNPLYITLALNQAGLIPENGEAHYLRTGILDKKCCIFQQ